MKPREFDDLIRQKFDQNDFEYNPQNWARLEEQLEGRTKKRSMIMWWWMPLAGVAASVALAIGISTMWRQAETGNAGVADFAWNYPVHHATVNDPKGAMQYVTNIVPQHVKKHANKTNNHPVKAQIKEADFGINLQNALAFNSSKADKKTEVFAEEVPGVKKKEQKKDLAAKAGYTTFKKDAESNEAPKLSILLSGGFNSGNQNSGYVGGVSIRRMISNKVFIESDVAFVSSNNTPTINGLHTYTTQGTSYTAAKTTKTTVDKTPPPVYHADPIEIPENYNISYAQVSPSIGVQVMKKLSIAAGPDFQQALTNNRPSTTPIANLSSENVAVSPLFDFGFMAKTEYSLSRKLKAQFSYRKGMNNALTPGDRFIDRNYMQLQVRCAIFNK